ncbi:MAG: acyl-CoA thioesterase [Desulfuromonadales bacterium]|nr:acyl-CoA thioesterase [Desulfuromonadales bacterium]
MESLLKEFPVMVKVSVAWGEMDAFEHVNNIVYFRYFENARIAYFEKLDYMKSMVESGVGPILASTQCQYRRPLTYPDVVQVGARISELCDDNFVMQYCIVSEKTGKIAAEGEALMVSYDYRNKKKAAILEPIKKKIIALEEEMVSATDS